MHLKSSRKVAQTGGCERRADDWRGGGAQRRGDLGAAFLRRSGTDRVRADRFRATAAIRAPCSAAWRSSCSRRRSGCRSRRSASELARLPRNRAPERADWAKLSGSWTKRIDERIAELERMKSRPHRVHRLRLPVARSLPVRQSRRSRRTSRGRAALLDPIVKPLAQAAPLPVGPEGLTGLDAQASARRPKGCDQADGHQDPGNDQRQSCRLAGREISVLKDSGG